MWDEVFVSGQILGCENPLKYFFNTGDPVELRDREIGPAIHRELPLIQTDAPLLGEAHEPHARNYFLFSWNVDLIDFHQAGRLNIQPELFEHLTLNGSRKALTRADLAAATFPFSRE